MAEMTSTKYNAPALDKGLDILEYLSNIGVPMSQGEIAQGINRTSSEIYRMLVCLEERAYLIRSGDTGKYRLSLKMYSLSHRHTPFDGLKEAARVPMHTLTETTRQSCHLSILYNDRLMPILQVRNPGPVSLSVEEGALFPLSLTTSGKVLLSMIPTDNRMIILSKDEHYPTWTRERQKELEEMVQQVAERGYCHINSELTHGVSDIAVPIGIPGSELISVLAVSTLTSTLDEELDFQELMKAIKTAQNEINALIGA